MLFLMLFDLLQVNDVDGWALTDQMIAALFVDYMHSLLHPLFWWGHAATVNEKKYLYISSRLLWYRTHSHKSVLNFHLHLDKILISKLFSLDGAAICKEKKLDFINFVGNCITKIWINAMFCIKLFMDIQNKRLFKISRKIVQ